MNLAPLTLHLSAGVYASAAVCNHHVSEGVEEVNRRDEASVYINNETLKEEAAKEWRNEREHEKGKGGQLKMWTPQSNFRL